MKTRKVLLAVIGSGILFGAAITILIHSQMLEPSETLERVALIEIFLSSFNIVILSALTTNYLLLYRDMATSTARSLTLFSSALLLYAISSSPVVQFLLGLKVITIGPLTYIPEIFVAIASLTLFYESYR